MAMLYTHFTGEENTDLVTLGLSEQTVIVQSLVVKLINSVLGACYNRKKKKSRRRLYLF